MRGHALGARTGAALAALMLGACATVPREPWLLETGELREPPVTDLERISTYPQALATTLDIMQRDLGLPTLHARLLFLPDTKSLEAVLLRAGYPPKLARDSARSLVAIGGHRIVLINQSRLEREGGWPNRVSFLAHELAHVLQYELGGGKRGTSAQWLREGFAKWVEVRVLETLGRESCAKARHQAIMRIRNQGQLRVMAFGQTGALLDRVERSNLQARVPPLPALGSFPDWVEQSRGESGAVLYDYAFVATLLLLEEHGVVPVMRYFELFAERQDPAASFLEAFGEREEELEERLREIVSP
jgi:hypothetical protein